jgi:hypothetical protein
MFNPFHNYKLKLRLRGIASITIPAGQIVSHIYTVEEKMWMTGAEYFKVGNSSDTVTFKIKNNGITLSTPAEDIFLKDHDRYEFYKSELKPNMEIEIIYKNNGTNDAEFRYNLIGHLYE